MLNRRQSLAARFLTWAYRFFIGPFEDKRDPSGRGSMTRWVSFLFALGFLEYLHHLAVTPGKQLGLPDAFLGFCVLFALGIAKAIDRAPPVEVVRSVTSMHGRGGGSSPGGFFSSTTTAYGPPVPEGPGVLTIEDLAPPVAHGRPDDGDADG